VSDSGPLGAGWHVPEHRAIVLAPRRTRYCVCIPVINEGERIRRQLARMQPLASAADVIIADGGSTDASVEPEVVATAGVRGVLVKTGPGKLAAQMRMAMAFALREGYEGVIFIDGNDKDDPAAIPAFLRALDEGADHVQGSRFIAGGREENTPAARLLGIKLVHAPLISLAARHRYTDTTNGFRAYSRRLLMDPRVAPFRDVFSGYELHYYLAIRAARLGFRCLEVPVTRSYPRGAPAPTKISPVRGNLRIIRTLVAACLHQFDPPPPAGGEAPRG
jgi:glycosyltransferase involved in cell wall biosynthesis